MVNSAPICLFVFNRPDHTNRTVEALLGNPEAAETDLIVFSDAARSPDEAARVDEVRRYVRGITGFRSLRVVERLENFGLARSIIDGVTTVVNQHGRVIVLEDDLVTSPHFLRYMNEALALYADIAQVASIHGYIYPVDGLPETFFLKGADCWGWATWKDRWSKFNPNGQELLDQLRSKKLERDFDFDGAYPYTQMLIDQIEGMNNSWAIRWHASAYLAGMYTLYPRRPLVANIGNDGSGTHCDATNQYDVKIAREPILLKSQPVQVDKEARTMIAEYFRSIRKSFPNRVLRRAAILAKSFKILLRGSMKLILPPIVWELLRSRHTSPWKGDFATWDEALGQATGYDHRLILEKVEEATDAVFQGLAPYERDSVIFPEIEYSWPTLAGLLWSAALHDELNVLDFGGSLGSSYRQNVRFLKNLPHRWNVVEQPHLVDVGRRKYRHDGLYFYSTIDECLSQQTPNTFFCSSTLQYLSNPELFLNDVVARAFPVLIFDRLSIIQGDRHRLTVQTVPEHIYRASYPCWFFSEQRLLKILSRDYELIEKFESYIKNETWIDGEVRSMDFGYIFRRRPEHRSR
jgi:putative methyltransferase (TIGR04325 family)